MADKILPQRVRLHIFSFFFYLCVTAVFCLRARAVVFQSVAERSDPAAAGSLGRRKALQGQTIALSFPNESGGRVETGALFFFKSFRCWYDGSLI